MRVARTRAGTRSPPRAPRAPPHPMNRRPCAPYRSDHVHTLRCTGQLNGRLDDQLTTYSLVSGVSHVLRALPGHLQSDVRSSVLEHSVPDQRTSVACTYASFITVCAGSRRFVPWFVPVRAIWTRSESGCRRQRVDGGGERRRADDRAHLAPRRGRWLRYGPWCGWCCGHGRVSGRRWQGQT
ncbi:MAG: hypothetical protein JWN52_6592 [Actinomycetia bacterium]|nr:hypothetical protein [Actinomycetes bacterium]